MGQHAELASNSPCIRGDSRRGIELRTSCLLACIVLFSAGLWRYWVSYSPSDFVFRGPESFRLAHNLYDTGNFANPFGALATGPSAHLSPVLPEFLALLMKVFGDRSAGIYAIKLAAAPVLSLQLALFPVFSRILFRKVFRDSFTFGKTSRGVVLTRDLQRAFRFSPRGAHDDDIASAHTQSSLARAG